MQFKKMIIKINKLKGINSKKRIQVRKYKDKKVLLRNTLKTRTKTFSNEQKASEMTIIMKKNNFTLQFVKNIVN